MCVHSMLSAGSSNFYYCTVIIALPQGFAYVREIANISIDYFNIYN
jgi:hypothetical protein